MQFLYPGFLWALAALAIPIIIHLFYFRRYKKVYFTNVRFLKEVKEETIARNKLRNLLILLMRLLAVAALVFAFAQPFIPVSDSVKTGIKHISIFVDNSFSMNAFAQDLPLIDKAKQSAEEVIAAYDQEDRFQLITHEMFGRQQRFLNRDEVIAQLESVDINPEVSMLSRIWNKQQQLFDREDTRYKIVYMISDFQRSIFDLPETIDTSVELNLVPVSSVQEQNLSIDSAWFDAPVQMLNQVNRLLIRVVNNGNEDAENIKLSMTIDGQEKPVSALNIPPGASYVDTANITILKTGWHKVVIRISDFPVQFDDTYYLTFYVDENVRVLAVNEDDPNQNLNAVFASNAFFSLENQSVNNLNFSAFGSYDLIILNAVRSISTGLVAELDKYVQAGGKLVIFPDTESTPELYNTLLATLNANRFGEKQDQEMRVSRINTDEFIFRDVFDETRRNLRLPVTQQHFPITRSQRVASEPLLTYRDGSSFIVKNTHGNGSVYLCASSLNTEVNDLVKNAEIFVPFLYKAAIAQNTTQTTTFTIGKRQIIEVDNPENQADKVFTLTGASEFIPVMLPVGAKMLLDPRDQIRDAGFYDVHFEDTLIGTYAFNYDRLESDLSCMRLADLRTHFENPVNIWESNNRKDLTKRIGEKDQGIILWKWCIILALIFLALEILLIRIWKS